VGIVATVTEPLNKSKRFVTATCESVTSLN
jgi:hypothetical protein